MSTRQLMIQERDPALAYWESLYLFIPVDAFKTMREELGRDFPAGLTLYLFYRLMAKEQKSNKLWPLDEFVRKSLGWTQDKFNKTKRLLVRHGFMKVTEVKKEKKSDSLCDLLGGG